MTTNGLQQQSIFRNSGFVSFADMPVWPGLLTPAPLPAGQFPDFTGVRVFSARLPQPEGLHGERGLRAGAGDEPRRATSTCTWAKGVHLTRFINVNRADRGAPFAPQLDEVMVTTSRGKSLYRGLTVGLRKRFSDGWQMEGNYVLSKDLDDDSNERDPFTDRSFDPFDLGNDYGPSDRDIRHKFNFYIFGEAAGRVRGQRAHPGARRAADHGRPARAERRRPGPQQPAQGQQVLLARLAPAAALPAVGDRTELIPTIEMFNTFNNDNNVNPLSTPALFNFDGFLRTGVGDPRQIQLAIKLTF